jgi:hypothetical protein
MGTETPLVGGVTIGLHNIEGSASLTFVFFIAFTMLAMLGLRFAYYARLNRIQTEIGTQVPIWSHLYYIGGLAVVYALLGLIDIVSSIATPYRSGFVLAMVLLIAFAVRQINYAASGSPGASAGERFTRAFFIGLVVVYTVGVIVTGPSTILAGLEGVGALAFLGYGLTYYQDQTSQSRLQGTLIDSLLRHLLPVLTFASLVSISSLAVAAGLDRVIVLHIQVVFVIMTATALMTATIKLRQNLASL